MQPKNPHSSTSKSKSPLIHFRNWLSLAGVIIVAGSLFAFLLLVAFDWLTGGSNPYVGILSYIVAPGFFFLGSFLAIAGWFWHWKVAGKKSISLRFNLTRLRDRRIFMLFGGGAILFMFISALGSYQTYTYTNSNQFCGTACHSVMEPQFAVYPNDTHAKINCVECHVGEGADGTIKAKWHGIYKVYSLAFGKYPKPLRADPHYLPATEESCLKCHDNDESLKDVAKTYHHYLSDDENTPFSVALRLKLSPSKSTAAETRGIHWHARSENQVDFTTTTKNPDIVSWIQVSKNGEPVDQYKFVPDEDDEIDGPLDLTSTAEIKRMDCLDCHSRPAHGFPKPNDLVETALLNGELPATLPELKYVIASAVDKDFENRDQAKEKVLASLQHSLRKQDPNVTEKAIDWTRKLFGTAIFPEMKADWKSYPDYIGHKDTLGCLRCHDDKHVSLDGSKTLSAKNCNQCHDVISQGLPGEMTFASAPNTEFEHPDGSYLGFTCAECHTGGLQLE